MDGRARRLQLGQGPRRVVEQDPAGLGGEGPLADRSSREVPRSSSSSRMWWLRAGWLRCSDSAARENEPVRVISASVRR